MSDSLGAYLFQSAGRSALLSALFVDGLTASVSELARRAGLSPRALSREVQHILPTGLVLVETLGGADLVRANVKHPATRLLRGLLTQPALASFDDGGQRTRESMTGWGAPLAGLRAMRHFSFTETLLRALREARTDGTVLRVLPALVARNLDAIDWSPLLESARREKLKAELGFVLEVSSTLTGRGEPREQVAKLVDRRRRTMRYFPEVKSSFGAALARQRSPAVATRWGFWMNLSEESFRSLHERHA